VSQLQQVIHADHKQGNTSAGDNARALFSLHQKTAEDAASPLQARSLSFDARERSGAKKKHVSPRTLRALLPVMYFGHGFEEHR